MKILSVKGATSKSNTKQELQDAIVKSLGEKKTPFKNHLLTRQGLEAPEIMVRSIPTIVLYSDQGLDIFDKITYCPEYYLTNAEINIFQTFAKEIVANISNGDCLIELGCGAMRKTKYLLQEIANAAIDITYHAVDLSEKSLTESLSPLAKQFPSIKFVGLVGTYHDSFHWISNNIKNSKKMFLWLGSSIGNYNRHEACEFLDMARQEAMNPGDLFLCGIDLRNTFEDISLAYNDPQNITRDFIMQGLDHCNEILGQRIFDRSKFEYLSIYNEVLGRHEAYYKSTCNQDLGIVKLEQDELINVEYSFKYSQDEIKELISKAGLGHKARWLDSSNRYSVYIFQSPYIYLPRHVAKPLELDEIEHLWRAWDLLTSSMISKDRLLTKPISLRHPYLFYIGHIPAFLDIQLSKVTNEPLTEPAHFAKHFERGIDPIVEDPTQCHAHSSLPEEWPTLEELINYSNRVRKRVIDFMTKPQSKQVKDAIYMDHEHVGMHLETLLYMIVQDSDHLKPPMPQPKFTKQQMAGPAHWVKLEGGPLAIGVEKESKDWCWDNEKGQHMVNVDPFEMQHRPVTIQEYRNFLVETSQPEKMYPSSWRDNCVLTTFGMIPLDLVPNWPVYLALFQAKAYAAHHQLDLPTEHQLKYALECENYGDNYGFVNLCPTDVQSFSGTLTDIVGNGWELTCTPFEPYPGFEPSVVYPGYSQDFFDGKHFVVLGASWATPPRIAKRKTFRNWYQATYPYVFAKFRLVKNQ